MAHVTRCALCASAARVLFDSRVSHGERVLNWICRGCGLVFMWPRPRPEELAAFYERRYRTTQQGTEEPTAAKLGFEEERAEAQLAILRKAAGPVRGFLDVGCGGGRLLSLVRERLGADVVGIEPGLAYLAFLRREGMTVYPSLEELLSHEPDRRFDLISLSHVLEHTSDPVAFLTTLRTVALQPGGRIYVEVPNLLVHTSFEPGHIYSFTVETLKRTVEAAGLGVTYLELHGRPRKRDPRRHYISMILAPARARVAAAPKAPSPAVVLVRRLVGHRGLDHPLWFLRNLVAPAFHQVRDGGR